MNTPNPDRLNTKLNLRRMTKQQEAFANLVAQGTPATEAVVLIYPDNHSPSTYGRQLLNNVKVAKRIDQLKDQTSRIRALNRDSLTIKALDMAEDAREAEKYSAGVSGLRLAADLQGLTKYEPCG